jgi:hypothetical protein
MENSRIQLLCASCALRIIWLTLISLLAGCSCVDGENGNGARLIYPEDSFFLAYSKSGGFGDVGVEIDVRRNRLNPVYVVVRIGKNAPVEVECSRTNPIFEKISAIRDSGVFDLPAENRKSLQGGRDLAEIKVVYRDSHGERTITRDYRWGERFEPRFHKAERVFDEIVHMVLGEGP